MSFLFEKQKLSRKENSPKEFFINFKEKNVCFVGIFVAKKKTRKMK
jgi:hypothetical protein